jgi:cell division protein FtsZ
MFELALDEVSNQAGVKLKVIGIGGAGSNAVNSMIESGQLTDVEFIVANTDAQALSQSPAPYKIQLGKKITKGLGAGSNPDIGRRAAEEDFDTILDTLSNTDILFLTAGLGGGTGSGAISVIAQAAKELGILTVGVVTKPFLFEGKRRQRHAEDALKTLKSAVDTLITVPNQRLIEISDPNISMLNAFALSNDILQQAIKGISDIITRAGHINVDFADVRTIMKDTGMAIMGTGRATGNDRARNAALRAISSPLLENASIAGAKGVLINITGNEDLGLQEINEAASMVYEMVNPDANIILGSVIDTTMGTEIAVTVIATGLEIQPSIISPTITVQPLAQSAPRPAVAVMAPAPIEPIPSFQQVLQVQPAPVAQAPVQAALYQEAPAAAAGLLQPLHAEESVTPHAATPAIQEQFDMDDLDTPTFMRKKASEHQAAKDAQTMSGLE